MYADLQLTGASAQFVGAYLLTVECVGYLHVPGHLGPAQRPLIVVAARGRGEGNHTAGVLYRAGVREVGHGGVAAVMGVRALFGEGQRHHGVGVLRVARGVKAGIDDLLRTV